MAFHSGPPECLVLLISKENFYGNLLLCRNFNSRINIKFDPVYAINNIKCHTAAFLFLFFILIIQNHRMVASVPHSDSHGVEWVLKLAMELPEKKSLLLFMIDCFCLTRLVLIMEPNLSLLLL